MRSAPLILLTLLIAGCAPTPGGGRQASDRRTEPAALLPAEQELEIREALYDALYADREKGNLGRDRIKKAGGPAVPILIQALADEDRLSATASEDSIRETRLRRQKLAILLGEIRDRRAIGPLLERYDGEYFARALEKITGRPLGDRLDAWREWYVDQPPDASPAELDRVIRLFRAQTASERLQTMQDLADAVRLKTRAAELLPDAKDPRIRPIAVRRNAQSLTVADLDRRRIARVLLVEGFQDPEPNVCRYAELVAIQLGPLAVMPLRPLARAGSPEVRRNVLRTLGEIADPRACPELEAALADPAPVLRITAAQALGQIGAASVTAALESRLGQEKDPDVRTAMLGGLAMCGRPDSFQELLDMLGGAGQARSSAQLEEIARKAFSLACQSVFGMRIPPDERAVRDYLSQQGLVLYADRPNSTAKKTICSDPERWKRWWAHGAQEILSPLPSPPPLPSLPGGSP